jgi:hypothetical protein
MLKLVSCLLAIGSIDAFMQSPSTTLSKTTLSTLSTLSKSSSKSSTTQLFGYIAADEKDEVFDEKQGGVGLAQDNAIVMIGKVDKKGVATATALKRYTKLSNHVDADADTTSIICKGSGTELYQDPGRTTEKTIILAPFEAAEKALNEADMSKNDKEGIKKISINFTGGDDVMVDEVLMGVENVVTSLNLTKEISGSIEFRSLCHESFPTGKSSVVVVSYAGGSDLTDNLYWHEGQWWTLSEDDLNPEL